MQYRKENTPIREYEDVELKNMVVDAQDKVETVVKITGMLKSKAKILVIIIKIFWHKENSVANLIMKISSTIENEEIALTFMGVYLDMAHTIQYFQDVADDYYFVKKNGIISVYSIKKVRLIRVRYFKGNKGNG